MPISVMTFSELGDRTIEEVHESVSRHAPPGSRVDVGALTIHFMRIALSADGTQAEITHEQDLPGIPGTTCHSIVWLPDSPMVESEAQRVANTLHAELGATGTGVFHNRIHLDKVGAGPTPPAYAVILNTRQQRHSRDEYIWYYRTHHVPLAVRLGPAFVRYSTHRTLHAEGDVIADTVTVQEFRSLDDIRNHVAVRIRPEDEGINDLGNFIGQVDYLLGDQRFGAAS